MKQKMEKEQYRVAKVHLVAGMQEGQSWQRAGDLRITCWLFRTFDEEQAFSRLKETK